MLAMRSMLQCHSPHQGELDDSCHVLSHALTSVRRSSSVRRAGQRPQPRRRRRIDGHGGVAFGVLLRRSDQARYTRRLRQIVGDQPIVGRHRDPVGGLGWPPRPGLPDGSRERGHSSLARRGLRPRSQRRVPRRSCPSRTRLGLCRRSVQSRRAHHGPVRRRFRPRLPPRVKSAQQTVGSVPALPAPTRATRLKIRP